jgi:hypothetical protein
MNDRRRKAHRADRGEQTLLTLGTRKIYQRPRSVPPEAYDYQEWQCCLPGCDHVALSGKAFRKHLAKKHRWSVTRFRALRGRLNMHLNLGTHGRRSDSFRETPEGPVVLVRIVQSGHRHACWSALS